MKNKINEKDIFNFVFSPHLLSEEKKRFLREDKRHESQILYYEFVKEAINSETSFNLKKKIAAKIPEYSFANVFTLNKVDVVNREPAKLIFAAKSKDEPPQIISHTFIDEEKTFLVRVITYEISTRVYVFSLANEPVKNLTIKIFPGEHEYFIKDDSEPLVIDKRIDVKSIELKIN